MSKEFEKEVEYIICKYKLNDIQACCYVSNGGIDTFNCTGEDAKRLQPCKYIDVCQKIRKEENNNERN